VSAVFPARARSCVGQRPRYLGPCSGDLCTCSAVHHCQRQHIRGASRTRLDRHSDHGGDDSGTSARLRPWLPCPQRWAETACAVLPARYAGGADCGECVCARSRVRRRDVRPRSGRSCRRSSARTGRGADRGQPGQRTAHNCRRSPSRAASSGVPSPDRSGRSSMVTGAGFWRRQRSMSRLWKIRSNQGSMRPSGAGEATARTIASQPRSCAFSRPTRPANRHASEWPCCKSVCRSGGHFRHLLSGSTPTSRIVPVTATIVHPLIGTSGKINSLSGRIFRHEA